MPIELPTANLRIGINFTSSEGVAFLDILSFKFDFESVTSTSTSSIRILCPKTLNCSLIAIIVFLTSPIF